MGLHLLHWWPLHHWSSSECVFVCPFVFYHVFCDYVKNSDTNRVIATLASF